jgi:hypothetical protein
LEKNKTAEREELKRYEQRSDLDIYQPILREVLLLFGTAIHTSLERTLGKYLKSTDGIYRNDIRDDWELKKVGKLLCTNNAAERPFAVAKGKNPTFSQHNLTLLLNTFFLLIRLAYMKTYQSLSLRTLAAFSLSMSNGSHRPAECKGKQKRTENKDTRQCGVALTAASDLQKAITNLCGVRKVNIGKVTAKLDAIFLTNSARADARRETKRKEEEEAEMRKIHKKGVKFNKFMEEPLAATIGDLVAHMNAMDNAIGVSKEYLKRQFNARLMRAENDDFNYPSIGDHFRANNKKRKIKMKPSDDQNEVEYLKSLVILMMKADSRRGAVDNEAIQLTGTLILLPMTVCISLTYTLSLTT